jgi:hypothetical protein
MSSISKEKYNELIYNVYSSKTVIFFYDQFKLDIGPLDIVLTGPYSLIFRFRYPYQYSEYVYRGMTEPDELLAHVIENSRITYINNGIYRVEIIIKGELIYEEIMNPTAHLSVKISIDKLYSVKVTLFDYRW